MKNELSHDLKLANQLFKNRNYSEALRSYNLIKSAHPEFGFLDFNIKLSEKRLEATHEDENNNSNWKINRKTFVGIASIPQREQVLRNTIDSLVNQVDEIGVFLDKYEYIPDYIKDYGEKVKIVVSKDFSRDLGDAGKFCWVETHCGYYFTCDDDLIYPKDYIKRLIEGIESYNQPVVLGWHGSVLLKPFDDYYNSCSRRVFSFGAPRPYDTPVHVLGTGCLGFHTEHLAVKLSDFDSKNMADVYFAILGQKQKTPFIVIKHNKTEITESENSQEFSIYAHSSQEVIDSRHNTKELQNNIVKSLNWNVNFINRNLNILIIGRFSINKKGGVYKSSHLLAEYLSTQGHKVTEICLSELSRAECFIHRGELPDFTLVYAPDPERPDFGGVIDVVQQIAKKGGVCAVNFSINAQEKRSDWIVQEIQKLNNEYNNPRIFVAVFSNATQLIDKLKRVEQYIVVIPKTLYLKDVIKRSYEEREGIFLGDLAKLMDDRLVFGSVVKWVEQIRIKLPHVNIYALKHYHTDKILANYIKIIPYTEDMGELLSKFKLHVCLTPGATFEMVPVEAAMSGTPVIHRHMPQSLSEYLSPVGTEVMTPFELGEMCRLIYERKDLWGKLSCASESLRDTLSIDNAIAAIEIGMRKCIVRANEV